MSKTPLRLDKFGLFEVDANLAEGIAYFDDAELMAHASHVYDRMIQSSGLSSAYLLILAAFVDAKRRRIKPEKVREIMLETIDERGTAEYLLLDTLVAARKLLFSKKGK